MKTTEQPKTKISYRPHDWLNTKENKPKFGIQAKAVGYECRWLHCAEGNKPLLFDTEQARDEKLTELRREQNRLHRKQPTAQQ